MQKAVVIALGVVIYTVVTITIQAQDAYNNRYAVLVGVGQYPHLDNSLELKGPANDVQLVHEYLTKVEGFVEEKIFRLTDGGSTPPRRANIIATLKSLEKILADDDFVLLYFAGHGSQQPAGLGTHDELDGLDEIFLPADVKKWNKDIRVVENAIVDDEVGQFISTYRHKGADVWVIFDSCSSGTMTRGLGNESMRSRRILPKDLDLPDESGDRQAIRGGGRGRIGGDSAVPGFTDIATNSPKSDLGALIQFFAAHASEETPERLFPKGAKKRKMYGLFTYSLVSVLYRFNNLSYDGLGQMIIAEYKRISHNTSTPQFYGTNMNSRVFGRESEHSPAFRATLAKDDLTHLSASVGILHGFDVSALVSIHPNAADKSVLGTGLVTGASLSKSTIMPEWEEGATVPQKDWQPVHVRLVEPAYEPMVRISEIQTASEADNRRLREIILAMKEGKIPLVEFNDYDSDADYFAAFFQGKFHLLRHGQTLPCSEQLISEDERRICEDERVPEVYFTAEPDKVAGLVWSAAKVRNLVRLQAISVSSASLKLEVEIKREVNLGPSGKSKTDYLSLSDIGGKLKADDIVTIRTTEEARDNWNLFFFWIDAHLGITAFQQWGPSIQLERGKSITRTDVVKVGTETTGTESFVIIADPGRRGIDANYRFLAQKPWSQIATRGGNKTIRTRTDRSPLQAILEAVWEGKGNISLRSENALPKKQAHVRVFTWTVEDK